MKAYFVTALHHEVFDGVFKWLLSEVGREEAGGSRGNSSSNKAIQRNSLFWTDVMFLMHNISYLLAYGGGVQPDGKKSQLFPKFQNECSPHINSTYLREAFIYVLAEFVR